MQPNIDVTVMTDERLNLLADRFLGRQIGQVLGLTFAGYLTDPEGYDRLYEEMKKGNGLRITETGDRSVVHLNHSSEKGA